MNELQKVFSYQEKAVRLIAKNGEPWFVGKDICEYFGDTNYRRSISRLDDDEKGVSQIDTLGGTQSMMVINESGFYSLLFSMQPQKGNLPEEQYEQRISMIKQFKRWVTHEVLPSIRRHGMYATNELLDDPDLMAEAIERLKIERSKNKLLQNENKLLEIENRLLSQENVPWANRKFIDALVKKYAEIKGPDKFGIQQAWTDLKKDLLYKHGIDINLRINSCVGRKIALRPLNAIRDDEISIAISTMVTLCKQNNVDISEVIKIFEIGF